jgi:hypothetical protein
MKGFHMIKQHVLDTSHNGLLTYWNTDDCDRIRLESELDAFGLKEFLPSQRRNISLLRDALEDFSRTNAQSVGVTDRMLIRPLDNGISIVNERKGRTANDFTTVISAWVDELGVVTTHPQMWQPPVYDRFVKLRDVITGPQVTACMVKIVDSWHGLRLRENGGLYWLNAKHFDRWREVAHAVERSTLPNKQASFFYVNHPVDEHVIDAMQDAIKREIEAETKRIMAELDEDDEEKKLGARALQTRRDHAEHLRAKLKSLSGILGSGLDGLKAMVDETDLAAANLALQIAAQTQTAAA